MTHPFRKKNAKFILLLSAFALVSILSFQNCGKGFQAGHILEGASIAGAPAGLNIPILDQRASKLSDTAYFRQYNRTNISNFKRFEPQYPLYSDNSTKRRWIYLPEDTQINTQNLDGWVFPKGTILWKEFTLDGIKIETRVLEKIGDGTGVSAWRTSVYLWRSDQMDADLLDPSITDFYTSTSFPNATMGEKEIYAAFDVQSRYRIARYDQCMTCHQGSADVSLGFNYLQLSSTRIVTIQILKDERKLSHPPMVYDELPGTLAQKAGLGYIQGNCAHCHMGRAGVPHNFKHYANNDRYTDEPIVVAAGNRAGLIVAGDPSSSILFNRFTATTNRMPQIGSAIIDPVGESVLNQWIMGFND
jgi:hypothetical protein